MFVSTHSFVPGTSISYDLLLADAWGNIPNQNMPAATRTDEAIFMAVFCIATVWVMVMAAPFGSISLGSWLLQRTMLARLTSAFLMVALRAPADAPPLLSRQLHPADLAALFRIARWLPGAARGASQEHPPNAYAYLDRWVEFVVPPGIR